MPPHRHQPLPVPALCPRPRGGGAECGLRLTGRGGEEGQDKFSVILVGGSSPLGGWEGGRRSFDGGRETGAIAPSCPLGLAVDRGTDETEKGE